MLERWNRFWFRPASPLGFLATRSVLTVTSLWILLSRPGLPDVLRWPQVMWRNVRPATRLRFLVFDIPFGVERALWVLLFVGLAAALVGVMPRLACAVASLLLYHFASLETILYHRLGPYFNGLTLPVLGLCILATVPHPRFRDRDSENYRWPVALIQILLAFNYTFSAVAKYRSAGFAWMSGRNLRDGLIVFLTHESVPQVLSRFLLAHVALCTAMLVVAFVTDSLFFLVPFSARLRNVLVPIAVFGHVAIAMSMGIVFLSAPYLIVYAGWDTIAERLRRPQTETAVAAST